MHLFFYHWAEQGAQGKCIGETLQEKEWWHEVAGTLIYTVSHSVNYNYAKLELQCYLSIFRLFAWFQILTWILRNNSSLRYFSVIFECSYTNYVLPQANPEYYSVRNDQCDDYVTPDDDFDVSVVL